MKYTVGAIRAAAKIVELDMYRWPTKQENAIIDIIEEETHCTDMLAFVEKVERMEYDLIYDRMREIKREAQELIKKVKG